MIRKTTVYALIQDHDGIKVKWFRSEEQARKTAARRPSYPTAGRPLNQGGTLWMLRTFDQWTLIEDLPGDYNVAQRGLYDTEGNPRE